jgi:hypothetical protein
MPNHQKTTQVPPMWPVPVLCAQNQVVDQDHESVVVLVVWVAADKMSLPE